MIFPLFPLTGVHIDHCYSKYELYSFEYTITKSSQEHPLCISLHIGLHINNNTPAGQHIVFIIVTAGVVFEIDFIFYCVQWVITSGKFHFICISRVYSCVFHVHLGCNFLDLELEKWPNFCISRCSRGHVFFDRDRIIIDRKLQGPS